MLLFVKIIEEVSSFRYAETSSGLKPCLTSEDLPALEAYEQHILERVEIGKQAGNAHWIEVNQKNLDERVRPAIALLQQGQVVAKTARHEREYTAEEWEQCQQNRKMGTHE